MAEHIHPSLRHIRPENDLATLRIAVPAVLGTTTVVGIFDSLVTAAERDLRPSVPLTVEEVVGPHGGGTMVDSLARQYPEHVPGPSSPLTFLDPDTPCSFFNAA